MPALSEEDIQTLFMWIDEIPLSRPKKSLTRDFSDGVLAAEVVKHFVPKLVELHNYAPANSLSQKIYNWSTLNDKVFRKLGYSITDPIIHAIANNKPGYVEYLLFELRQKIEEYLIHKPAMPKMPKIHKKPKHKPSLSKQSSEKSIRSDRTSESEKSHSNDAANTNQMHDTDFNGIHNPLTSGYQNVNNGYIQSASGVGHQNSSVFSAVDSKGYPPAQGGYHNTESYAPRTLAPSAQSKPRVMIKEPLPHHVKSSQIKSDSYAYPSQNDDYGREMSETLRMMQLKIEKLETLLHLKDQKIDELSRQVRS